MEHVSTRSHIVFDGFLCYFTSLRPVRGVRMLIMQFLGIWRVPRVAPKGSGTHLKWSKLTQKYQNLTIFRSFLVNFDHFKKVQGPIDATLVPSKHPERCKINIPTTRTDLKIAK